MVQKTYPKGVTGILAVIIRWARLRWHEIRTLAGKVSVPIRTGWPFATCNVTMAERAMANTWAISRGGMSTTKVLSHCQSGPLSSSVAVGTNSKWSA